MSLERSRKRKQDSFIRICRDSGFKIDFINATKLAASVVGCHPMEIANAFASLDLMRAIASGEHPSVKNTRNA